MSTFATPWAIERERRRTAYLPTSLVEARAENRPWYVITVPEGRELRAREAVRGLGHAAWLPTEIRRVRSSRHGRGTRPQRIVALPGYLFAAVEPGADWHEIAGLRAPRLRTTLDGALIRPDEDCRDASDDVIGGRWVRLVTGWLPVHGEPQRIPAREMAALFDLQTQWETEGDRGAVRRRFAAGSVHEIMSGPFAGMTATVTGTAGDQVRALVSVFGTATPARLPAAVFGEG